MCRPRDVLIFRSTCQVVFTEAFVFVLRGSKQASLEQIFITRTNKGFTLVRYGAYTSSQHPPDNNVAEDFY